MRPPWATFPPWCKHTCWPRECKERKEGKKQYEIPMAQSKLASRLSTNEQHRTKKLQLISEVLWLITRSTAQEKWPQCSAHSIIIGSHLQKPDVFIGKESGWYLPFLVSQSSSKSPALHQSPLCYKLSGNTCFFWKNISPKDFLQNSTSFCCKQVTCFLKSVQKHLHLTKKK